MIMEHDLQLFCMNNVDDLCIFILKYIPLLMPPQFLHRFQKSLQLKLLGSLFTNELNFIEEKDKVCHQYFLITIPLQIYIPIQLLLIHYLLYHLTMSSLHSLIAQYLYLSNLLKDIHSVLFKLNHYSIHQAPSIYTIH